jgi:hypothetical protein
MVMRSSSVIAAVPCTTSDRNRGIDTEPYRHSAIRFLAGLPRCSYETSVIPWVRLVGVDVLESTGIDRWQDQSDE